MAIQAVEEMLRRKLEEFILQQQLNTKMANERLEALKAQNEELMQRLEEKGRHDYTASCASIGNKTSLPKRIFLIFLDWNMYCCARARTCKIVQKISSRQSMLSRRIAQLKRRAEKSVSYNAISSWQSSLQRSQASKEGRFVNGKCLPVKQKQYMYRLMNEWTMSSRKRCRERRILAWCDNRRSLQCIRNAFESLQHYEEEGEFDSFKLQACAKRQRYILKSFYFRHWNFSCNKEIWDNITFTIEQLGAKVSNPCACIVRYLQKMTKADLLAKLFYQWELRATRSCRDSKRVKRTLSLVIHAKSTIVRQESHVRRAHQLVLLRKSMQSFESCTLRRKLLTKCKCKLTKNREGLSVRASESLALRGKQGYKRRCFSWWVEKSKSFEERISLSLLTYADFENLMVARNNIPIFFGCAFFKMEGDCSSEANLDSFSRNVVWSPHSKMLCRVEEVFQQVEATITGIAVVLQPCIG
eukprot:764539-Hanusia_phi.AAC.6